MQRVLFARLLQDAQLVLLDEPFNAIDTRTMTDLLKIITRWHGEGRTILAYYIIMIPSNSFSKR